MASLFDFKLLVHLCVLGTIVVTVRGYQWDEGSGDVDEGEWEEDVDYGGPRKPTCAGAEELLEVKKELKILRKSIEGLRLKLDPEYKAEKEENEIPTKNCPHGFHFLPKAGGCYRIVYEAHNWTSADARCRRLSPDAHLVAITTPSENEALLRYLAWDLGLNSHKNVCILHKWGDKQQKLWTAGRRRNDNCSEPFEWRLSPSRHQPLSYSRWSTGEPNCAGQNERCMHIRPRNDYQWNDVTCAMKLCPVCEYDPPKNMRWPKLMLENDGF